MNNKLRVSDVAQELGLSSQTIYKWHQKGDFVPMIKFGGTYRIDENEYTKWKQEHILSSEPKSEA
jgi:excisionase family DNA binding protein